MKQGISTTGLIAFIITGVWAVSVISDIFVAGYSPPVEIHAIMALVAGFFFGKDAFERAKRGGSPGES